MAKSIIAYDKDLPEIPGRCPWEKPTSFLVKDACSAKRLARRQSGRRPSRLLLIQKLRAAVDRWRDAGYPGASDVTRRLFAYWFEEDHEVAGFPVPFRYHFCQREAIETLAYVVEIVQEPGRKSPGGRIRQGIPEGSAVASPSSSRPRWTADARFAAMSPS